MRLSALAIALIVSVSTISFANAGEFNRQRPTLTVTGDGVAMGVPDLATISSGILTVGKSSREAVDLNSEAMTNIIDAIVSAGVERKDVATSGFSVQPRFNYEVQPPQLAGYEVQNTVTVTVRDITNLSSALDAVVANGSNQISGLAFGHSQPDVIEDEARKDAFADARRKAELYAEAAGMHLGRVLSLSEQGYGGGPVVPMLARADMAVASGVPIANGERETRLSVNVTFELNEFVQ